MKQNQDLYNVFLGYLIKKGNKKKAKNILDEAFLNVSTKLNLPISIILKLLLQKMGNIVEIKTIKMRANSHLVPFPLNKKRRNYLLVKKIMSAVLVDTSNRSIIQKFSEEIINILIEKSSKSVLNNKNVMKQVIQNRANVHYRW